MRGPKELISLLATKLGVNRIPGEWESGQRQKEKITGWVLGSAAGKERRAQGGDLGLLSVF